MTDAASDVPEADKVMEILAKIEAGESENAACQAVGMNRMTFRSRALKLGAANKYAESLGALAHAQAEKLEQAIEDMRAGVIDAQMARVEIDARKWFASKFLPKRYGDKQTTELTGADGGPIQSATTLDVSGLSDEQLKVLASIQAK
jgi:hypothetical protein